MIITDLNLSGDMSDTRRPALGLIKNGVEKQVRRAASMRAFAPISKLDLTAESELLILARASGLYYLSPLGSGQAATFVTATSKDGEMKLDTTLFDKVFELREVNYYNNRPDEKTTRFTMRPKVAHGKWVVFRDPVHMYMMMRSEDFSLFMNDMQQHITHSISKGYFEPKLVGLACVSSVGAIHWGPKPKDQIKFEKNAMHLTIPAEDLDNYSARVIATYHNLLACALNKLYQVVNEETKTSDLLGINDDHGFWHSYAAFMLASYGRLNPEIPKGKVYNAYDIEEKMMAYMGLPFSDAYPHLSLRFNHGTQDENDKAIARVLKAVLYANIILGICVERIGALTLPVEYMRTTMASRHFVKSQLERYLRPTHDLGGSGLPFYMPCAVNSSKPGTILVPYPVTTGYNEYVPGVMRKEEFTELVIDRGEIARSSIEALDGKTALVTVTRDVRVMRVRDENTEEDFVLIRYPVPSLSPKDKETGIHWLLSYVTDAEMRPGPALVVDDSFASAKPAVVAKGNSPMYTLSGKDTIKGFDSDGVKLEETVAKPMPGGFAVEDTEAEKPAEVQFANKTTDTHIKLDEKLEAGAVEEMVPAPDGERAEEG